MNINDIPLPPPLISSSGKIIKPIHPNILKINISDDKHVSSINRVPQSPRRYVNHKLPVGMIKRPPSSQLFDSLNHHHKELFLPPSIKNENRKLNSNSILLKSTSKDTSKIQQLDTSDKKIRNYNNDKERKRKGSEVLEKEVKHQKYSHRSKIYHDKPTNSAENQAIVPVYMKSQVIVKKKLETQKISDEPPKNHHNSQEYNKSKYQRSPDHDKISNRENKVLLNNKISQNQNSLSKPYTKCKRRKVQSPQSLSSSSSTTTNSSSTSSSENDIDCSSVDLPLVSPRSPEEEQKSMTFSYKNYENVAETTRKANDYLKQLSETLLRVNQAYQSAYSKIPNEVNHQYAIIDVENIPLPLEENHRIIGNITTNVVGPKTPKLPSDISKNDKLKITKNVKSSSIEKPQNSVRQCSNSINVDNLSHDSNSSFGSKNIKSPYYSVNVSSHSKESERSEMKARVLIPKISTFTIDYNGISGIFSKELFFTNHMGHFMDSMKCCCTMPNPDEWNEGFRSCSKGFNCVLAQLKIECDNKLCPTESLCSNTQFTDLEKSIHKMYNVEFFFDIHQSIPWKLRAKKPIERHKLIFEVAGDAECYTDDFLSTKGVENVSIFITPHIKISTKKDTRSYLYYLNHIHEPDQANVNVEKWIVNGNVRVGLFALRDLQCGEELVVFYPPTLQSNIFYSQPVKILNDADALSCVKFLLHEPVSYQSLILILNSLFDSRSDTEVLERFVDFGGLAVLCRLCDTFFQDDAFPSDLFEKLIDLMSVVPYQNRKHADVIGFDLPNFVDHLNHRLLSSLPSTYHYLIEKLKPLNEIFISLTTETIAQNQDMSMKAENKILKKTSVSSNFDILHCRLPPYWCSKECFYNDEFKVFFYHRVTKSMQWEMPVYPWEANDNNDMDIYDYNMASLIQVSHDEILQMYNHLNKIYENKQKKIIAQGNVLKRKKDTTELQRKEIFKKRITELIGNLLKPYRSVGCTEGKIESDEDLNYLTKKLSQTIMCKELKILNEKVDNLEVNAQVEMKTKGYVRTYMKSRGIIYKRPVRNTTVDQKNKPRKANINS